MSNSEHPESATTTVIAPASPEMAQAQRGHLGRGIGAGIVAALVGAALWAIITVKTEYQIGFMAIGVGLLVGFAVQRIGRGVTPAFGLAGGVLALAGCVLGNLFSTIGFLSIGESMPMMSVANLVLGSPSLAIALMREAFSPIDLLFYAIAVYEGYRIAMKPTAPA